MLQKDIQVKLSENNLYYRFCYLANLDECY